MTYCGDCGRALRDGETCTCTAQPGAAPVQQPVAAEPVPASAYTPEPTPYAAPVQPAYQPQPVQPEYAPQQPGAYYAPVKQPGTIGYFLKNFYKFPNYSASHVLGEGKRSDVVILGGIYALLCAIYLPLLLNRLARSVFEAVYMADYGAYITPQQSAYMETQWAMFKMPSLQFAVTGVVVAAVLLALAAVCWLIVGRGGPGGPVGYKKAFAGMCVASYPASLALAVACLLSFVSVGLSLVFAAVSAAAMLAQSASTMQDATGGARPSYLYGFLFFICVMLTLVVMWQLLDRQLINISFEGMTLKQQYMMDMGMPVSKLTDILPAGMKSLLSIF